MRLTSQTPRRFPSGSRVIRESNGFGAEPFAALFPSLPPDRKIHAAAAAIPVLSIPAFGLAAVDALLASR